MKDSYDKDPFAEYDKYWHDLDKQEEDVKKKNKDYVFEDVDADETYRNKPSGMKTGKIPSIIGLVVVFTLFYIFVDSSEAMFTPVIGIIIFGVLMTIIKNKKNN